MSENALDRKGELGRYSIRPNQKLTCQCERQSGILHPWMCEVICTTAERGGKSIIYDGFSLRFDRARDNVIDYVHVLDS